MPTNGLCRRCHAPKAHGHLYCPKCAPVAMREARRRAAERYSPSKARAAKSPQSGQRTCLSCDVTFLSEGPWHRRCHQCDERLSKAPRGGRAGEYAHPVARGSRRALGISERGL